MPIIYLILKEIRLLKDRACPLQSQVYGQTLVKVEAPPAYEMVSGLPTYEEVAESEFFFKCSE